MKLPLITALLLSLLFAGCVIPPRADSPQATLAPQAPHRFDSIATGMSRRAVVESLGAPLAETEQGRLRWEDRHDEKNYDLLEVGFDEAGAVNFIKKTKSTQTIYRT
jgi:outer membrane protein assembly factor BamE (lipoprotein component of BamABCDE complex)